MQLYITMQYYYIILWVLKELSDKSDDDGFFRLYSAICPRANKIYASVRTHK